MINYTYILRCKDGSLYTGWTNDLENRLKMHNSGLGAKYTKGRGPCELVYFETFDNKNDALKREYAIKKLPKEKKEELIKEYGNICMQKNILNLHK
jgi:putative endonuclease